MNIKEAVLIIQKNFRGYNYRKKKLPLILYYIQNYLKNKKIILEKNNNDGRVNSIINEKKIIKLLKEKFKERIKETKIRMWYDICVYDYLYGWIPINIKITTTLNSDNISNLTSCVYKYTNFDLNLNKKYNNGEMSKILINKLKNNEINNKLKKDYYFIVLNKNNNDIIINSLKGINNITSNNNNLPFQICWNKNKEFEYKKIDIIIKQFILTIQKPKPTWQEYFIENIRKIKLD